jgi:hypothetical protein
MVSEAGEQTLSSVRKISTARTPASPVTKKKRNQADESNVLDDISSSPSLIRRATRILLTLFLKFERLSLQQNHTLADVPCLIELLIQYHTPGLVMII